MNKKEILLVEDDPELRAMVTELLESDGYEVRAVDNGQVALDVLQDGKGWRPAVILLDLMMPVLDGLEFRKRQLADDAIANIPVIVMTAGGTYLINEARGDVTIRKPMSAEVLLESVRLLTQPPKKVRHLRSV